MNFDALVTSKATDLYTMIGSPITQVKSPALFNTFFREKGLDAELVAVDVPRSEVEAFFRYLRSTPRIKGCIVTVPHKQASANHLDELSVRAEVLGAVNVVRSDEGVLSGDMVDGLGFLEALRKQGFTVAGKQVALIGAGAAGSAIAHALAESNPQALTIHEIDGERHAFIRSLVERGNPKLELSFDLEGLSGYDLVINASPVGMDESDELPFPMDDLESTALVFDVVTEPRETAWLTRAKENGCEVIYGEAMVQGQFTLMARHMGIL